MSITPIHRHIIDDILENAGLGELTPGQYDLLVAITTSTAVSLEKSGQDTLPRDADADKLNEVGEVVLADLVGLTEDDIFPIFDFMARQVVNTIGGNVALAVAVLPDLRAAIDSAMLNGFVAGVTLQKNRA